MTQRNVNGNGARVCLDEIVARDATVHLEDLGQAWMLIIESGGAIAHFNLPKRETKRFDAMPMEVIAVDKFTVDGKESGDALKVLWPKEGGA